LIVCNSPQVFSEEKAADSGDEWDTLLNGSEEVTQPGGEEPPGLQEPDRPIGPDQRGPRQDMGRGPGRGPGMSHGFGPVEGRGRFGLADPEEVLVFLKEHEPELAAQLEKMKEENPRQYRRRFHMLGRLYGPVIEQMKHNPEMGEFTLKRIKTRFKIENTLKKIDATQDADQSAALKGPLRKQVGDLFDIIIEQEQMRLHEWQGQFIEWAVPDETAEEAGPGPGKDRGKSMVQERMKKLAERLKEHEANLESWKKRREQIIDARLDELLNHLEPFPWGR
jgi:hypothetical protein